MFHSNVFSGRSRLADDLIVVGVRSDPEPLDAVVDIVTECAVVVTHSYGPQRADPLEVKRRMLWIV